MTDAPPAVSVVMAVWNPDPLYFRQAVESILAQTFTDFELILVEDPSPQLAADLLAGIDDERVRIHRLPQRGGLPAALNTGLSLARAPLIARMDGDDIAVAERFARQVEFLEAHPEIDVHGSRITIIDADGRTMGRRLLPLTHDEIAAALRRYNCISHPSVMMRKRAVDAVGGYDGSRSGEDYDLWCRMLKNGARFASAADDLVRYRFHPAAMKFDRIHGVIRDTMAIKHRHFESDFTVGDRLRLVGERLLLLVPPRLVLWLFTKREYRRA
jgi:glycosyltransferase involved in cell wall biosynthesis